MSQGKNKTKLSQDFQKDHISKLINAITKDIATVEILSKKDQKQQANPKQANRKKSDSNEIADRPIRSDDIPFQARLSCKVQS